MGKKDEKKTTTKKTRTALVDQKAIAVGLSKGHPVTKRKLPARPSHKKGTTTKRVALIREIVRDVSGFAPYERRILELLRNGLEKRAMKVTKKKLGTHRRAKIKFNELSDTLRKVREQKAREEAQ